MRRILGSLALLPLLVWSVSLSGQATNTLTAQEKAQGWQLLFDGKTLNGWHSAGAPSAESRRRRRHGVAAAPPAAQPGALPAVGSCSEAVRHEAVPSVPAGSSTLGSRGRCC